MSGIFGGTSQKIVLTHAFNAKTPMGHGLFWASPRNSAWARKKMRITADICLPNHKRCLSLLGWNIRPTKLCLKGVSEDLRGAPNSSAFNLTTNRSTPIWSEMLSWDWLVRSRLGRFCFATRNPNCRTQRRETCWPMEARYWIWFPPPCRVDQAWLRWRPLLPF